MKDKSKLDEIETSLRELRIIADPRIPNPYPLGCLMGTIKRADKALAHIEKLREEIKEETLLEVNYETERMA